MFDWRFSCEAIFFFSLPALLLQSLPPAKPTGKGNAVLIIRVEKITWCANSEV